MNQHSFIHYMILSSANAGINTVPVEEEELWFFRSYGISRGCPSASQSLLHGQWVDMSHPDTPVKRT